MEAAQPQQLTVEALSAPPEARCLELPLPAARAARVPADAGGAAAIVRGRGEAVARTVWLLLLLRSPLPPAGRVGRGGAYARGGRGARAGPRPAFGLEAAPDQLGGPR